MRAFLNSVNLIPSIRVIISTWTQIEDQFNYVPVKASTKSSNDGNNRDAIRGKESDDFLKSL